MNNSSYNNLLISLRERPILTYLFTGIFALGLIGNCLVVAVIACQKRYRTSTYILIASMATSDAFGCTCLIVYTTMGIILLHPNDFTLVGKEIFCDFFGVTIYASYYISTHILVIMSVDRYFVFVKIPYQALLYNSFRLRLAIILSWVTGLLVVLPQIYTGGIDPRFPYICDAINGHSLTGQIYFISIVVFEEILPAIIIIYAYSHVVKAINESSATMQHSSANNMNAGNLQKRQFAVRKIIVITTLFLILTGIVHITRLVVSLTDATVIHLYMRNENSLASIINIFYGIAFLQPVVNPIVFCLMSKTFCQKILRTSKEKPSMVPAISLTYVSNN
ncbi:uncharacterized protein TRIADDRAFT_56807 [Trichoplax adhaerens]|uniref:G-protein coupled receptors family 1 profile domain-containing protein n=1 Tax=Trichoplax adhaerens TaxID=10228 RepID=B3RWM2_TRIAD|nr:hypothetical protein TRIADDRAFT_56807 [Trichoplax adhaerens]EDV25156.1 hypothetical protein TRIADDRAFT_56807 [Trichoplax adhaerens]|eukprot:XP_002113046.1 hypothetical protein TRIADDRAFT_56807 [Trichoplax adhaerens]